MYTLTRSLGLRAVLAGEALGLALALVVAEAFFRFGSFTLEAVAFLATWFGFGWLASRFGGSEG